MGRIPAIQLGVWKVSPESAVSAERSAHNESSIQRVSIVVPVYRGERTVQPLLAEIATFASLQISPRGRRFMVAEVLLVHDCGPGPIGSDDRGHGKPV